MAHANEAALQALLPLLRQLRDIKGLREVKPGIFFCRGVAFVHLHDKAGVMVAELKKAGGSGFDRYAIDTPTGQRKLVDDARRRVGRGDDD